MGPMTGAPEDWRPTHPRQREGFKRRGRRSETGGPVPRLSSEDVERFRREGYLRIPNVFSPNEIEQVREAIRGLGKNPKLVFSARDATKFRGSLHNYRGLASFPFDGRILDVVRSVLGDSAAYFGDSSVQMGQGPRGLHRDNIHRFNPLGPDWEGDYPLVRLGVYFGEFDRDSGGLKLVPRSHRPLVPFLPLRLQKLLNRGTRFLTPPFRLARGVIAIVQGGVDVPSHTGDLLIWSFRLLHSGNAVKLRRHPKWALPVWIEKRAPESWRQPGNLERMVFFCAFANPGPHLTRYLDGRRPADLLQWKHTRWDAATEAWAREKGVALVKPDPEVGSLYQGTEPEESGHA